MNAIKLDQQPPHYAAGENITGELTWSELPADCSGLELRLFWYTSGKGDRDLEVVAKTRLKHPGPEGRTRFEFSSPLAPYSFSGKLISLIWGIEAVPLPSGESCLIELVIAPRGIERKLGVPLPAES